VFRTSNITRDWDEAGSFAAQINLFGFWDEHAFLTKSGDLGAVLKIGGIDYESLDHTGRDYAAKRVEAAFRSLDDKTRLYQILFKRNRPPVPHADYDNPLIRASVEQRTAFLKSKADRLYSIEIYWVVMIDGTYAKTGLLHALAQLPKSPRSAIRDLRALFSGNKERTLMYEQVEHDRLRLQQKVQSLSGQLNDLMKVELPGAEETFRTIRCLVNLRPPKFQQSRLFSTRHLDWQVCDSELEAQRGYLRMDDDYLRVMTLKELPSETRPLSLQGLFDIPANFHVVTEWHPIDNAKARKEIGSRRRHHHNSKTSFVSNLQDSKSSGPQDNLVDDSKAAAVSELGGALTVIGMEGKNFGEYTLSVVIYDEDRVKVEHALAEFQKLFMQHDGLLYEERYNLLNAYFATIPGNRQFNLRKQFALNSNHADLSFLFTVDTGSEWNPHLEREYLAVLESTHGTPYYMNLHSGDVAHTLLLGATGSGKSTLLGVLADAIPEEERILLIEDTAELHIRKPHIVSTESQTDTHKSKVTFDDLLKAVLRHRPDRIIVGEVRGPEARTLLDAMNTGHRGTLATIHANGAEESVRRLASLAIRDSANLELSVAEADVRRCLDIVVYISRRQGRRHIDAVIRL